MTAQAIGSLYAQLGLDSAQFDTALPKKQKALLDFGKIDFSKGIKAGLGEIEGGLASLNGGLGAAGGLLSGLGLAGVAAGAAIAAAFAGARDAMSFGDEIADTANKLKVSTDYLQEMRFAAHQLGGDFQDADEALEGFTKTFGLATSGLSSKALKPFTALGLDPKDFKSVQAALTAVIDRISELGSAAEQAAVADKLGLTPLLPAIREGTGAIDGLRKAAQDLGYVMDGELIEKAGDANDQYEALTAVLDVQFKSAMVEAIPLVMTLTEWMVTGAKAAGGLAKGLEAAGRAAEFVGSLDPFAAADAQEAKAYDDRKKWRRTFAAADFMQDGAVAKASNLSSIREPQQPALTAGLKNQAAADEAARDAARASAQAQREATAAERKRLDGLLALNAAMRDVEQKSADYAASLLDDIVTMGMSTDQLRRRRTELEAAAAPTEALANLIRGLGGQYEAQAKVGREAADVQKGVNAQMADTITTINDAIGGGIHLSSTWEGLAIDAGRLSDQARELRYDIEDIAYAINRSDWTSALAGLAGVLSKVEKAFKNATDAKDKYSAVAQLAQGVGTAVGGTGGAVLGGAGAGALAGLAAGSALTTLGLVSGPIGWAALGVGALVGGLGGLFGSSSAKKKAKAQAEAQRQAEEAQRQQQIANTKRQLEIDLLRAQGKEVEAVALERQTELEALTKLDASLAAQKQAYYDAVDAAKAKADAEALAAQVTEKRGAIQDAIDKLTMSSAELLAKARAEERAEAVALDPALGALIDKLFGLQDAATDAAKASEDAAAAQSQFNWLLSRSIKEADDQAARAAEAQEAYTSQMSAFSDAANDAAHALDDAMSSLISFADSLKSELGLGSTGGGLDAARRAFNAAVALGDYSAIADLGGAYVDAAKDGASSRAEYLRIVAQVRAASLNSVTSAKSAAYQDSLTKLMIGALFRGSSTGDYSGLDAIRQLQAAGLPGMAQGGSMVIGGRTGVDQNLLSLNGAPVARVNYGETLSVTPAGALNDNSLGAEVRALRQQVADLTSIVRSVDGHVERLDRNIDSATEGGRAMLTEVYK